MSERKLKADAEGVATLRAWATGIEENVNKIKSLTDSIKDEIEGLSEIGPHKGELLSRIDEIQEATAAATSPAQKVAERLERKASQYQKAIDKSFYGNKGE